jgi:TonB family protein
MQKMRLALAATVVAATVSAQDGFSPARYRGGSLPALPVLVVGGGQVLLELNVDRDGRVTATKALRTTPPFADAMAQAARDWQFLPAEIEMNPEPGSPNARRTKQRVASRVLFAGLFRPPTLNVPTIGELPKDVAAESDETPYPVAMTEPAFPPLARDAGVVLVEARVDRRGIVTDAKVIRAAPPFDAAARTAAVQWRFRPARVGGRPVESLVYILFGFPSPIG